MLRRNKVAILIGDVPPGMITDLTVSPTQHLCIDYVIMIAGIKYPEFLPQRLRNCSPVELADEAALAANYMMVEETEWAIFGEYAEIINDRNDELRFLWGHCTCIPWLLDSIRKFHKNLRQILTNITILSHNDFLIDNDKLSYDQLVERLRY